MNVYLRSLLAFWRTICHPGQAIDAHVDAMVLAALGDDPIYQALEAEFARIDAACQRFAAELDELDEPNPLCVGHRCESCGVFLDKPERPCPLGCAR